MTDEKINANLERANMALGTLMDAALHGRVETIEGLDAAKQLESAACQLRRALKKKVG